MKSLLVYLTATERNAYNLATMAINAEVASPSMYKAAAEMVLVLVQLANERRDAGCKTYDIAPETLLSDDAKELLLRRIADEKGLWNDPNRD